MKARNPLVMGILGHELTLTLALAGNPKQSIEWGERILAALNEVSTTPLPVWESNILRPLVLAYVLAGDVAKATAGSQRVEQIHTRTLLACAFEDWACVGWHCFRRGDHDRARTILEEAVRILGARNQLAAISGCSFALGILEMFADHHRTAEELLQRSLAICRHGGNVLFQLWVLPALAELYLEMARFDDARRCIEDAAALMVTGRTWYGVAGRTSLAGALLSAAERRWDDAERAFETALAINGRYGLPFDEAKTLAAWGRMLIARAVSGDRERARERLGEALAIFERVGAVREVAKVQAMLEPLRG